MLHHGYNWRHPAWRALFVAAALAVLLYLLVPADDPGTAWQDPGTAPASSTALEAETASQPAAAAALSASDSDHPGVASAASDGAPVHQDRQPAGRRGTNDGGDGRRGGSSGEGPGDTAPPEGLVIAGVVVDDRGHPLPATPVQLLPVAASGPVAVPPRTQATDGFGMFRFEGLPEGEYQVSVPPDDDHLAAHAVVRAGVELVELMRQRIRDLQVTGIVSDDRGRPVRDVHVGALGSSESAFSGGNGGYGLQVRFGRGGQAPVLEFRHDGYRSLRRQVPVEAIDDSDAVRLDVQLDPVAATVVVAGRVLDSEGAAAPGRSVALSSPISTAYHRRSTNASGRYRFDEVEVGDGYRLFIAAGDEHLGHRSDPFTVDRDTTLPDVVLEAIGFASIAGQLTDPDGMPLPNFSLWLRAAEAASSQPQVVRSDPTGSFRVERVPAGALRLETRSQPLLQVSGIVLEPGEERVLSIPLDWGRYWLSGRVVDRRGLPVPGARLVVQWSFFGPGLRSASRREAGTDVTGSFAFSNLGSGPHTLTVQAPGFDSFRRQYDPAAISGDLDIVLGRDAAAGGH